MIKKNSRGSARYYIIIKGTPYKSEPTRTVYLYQNSDSENSRSRDIREGSWYDKIAGYIFPLLLLLEP